MGTKRGLGLVYALCEKSVIHYYLTCSVGMLLCMVLVRTCQERKSLLTALDSCQATTQTGAVIEHALLGVCLDF